MDVFAEARAKADESPIVCQCDGARIKVVYRDVGVDAASGYPTLDWRAVDLPVAKAATLATDLQQRIAEAHAASVAWRTARIDELKQELDKLTSTPNLTGTGGPPV